jgi:hypothetical protein
LAFSLATWSSNCCSLTEPGSSISADFLRGERLVSHVHLGGGIVAGDQHAEAGAHTALHKRVDLLFQRGTRSGGEGFSVEDLSGHGGGAV